MRADLLHVFTARANPLMWKVPDRIFRDFAQHMLDSGVVLHVIECAYGERPFVHDDIPGVDHIGVRARTMVWSKESLLNVGISRVPEAKYIAWFDSDVFFRRPTWAVDTVHALQLYDFVQPWTDCYDLGPGDEHLAAHRSFARVWHDRLPIMQGPNAKPGSYTFAHPGYAWAATRHALTQVGGLIDTAALGAADHHMAMALIGRVHDSIPRNLKPAYGEPMLRWQERAARSAAGNLGYVAGTIEHSWHGPKAARRYVDRWELLRRHGFDPNTDLIRNLDGVVELAGNKPELRHAIDAYFRQRIEDSNAL